MNDSLHIAELISKRLKGSITSSEQQELDQWIAAESRNKRLYEQATNPKEQLEKLAIYQLFRKEKVRANLENELFGNQIIRLAPQKLYRYAAAILLPLLVAGAMAILLLRTPGEMPMANLDTFILPGTEKGILILSNGAEIDLTDSANLGIIPEGNATIQNLANRLEYASGSIDPKQNGTLIYNELRTPPGGTYMLHLADGSRVWVNAGSSLKFPVIFQENVREVYLEGEAYFEVSHNEKPFIVHAGPTRTQVLGTSFNISAYSDDEDVVTTLLEGSVRVESEAKASKKTLKPNEQASYSKTSSIMSKTSVEASEFASWVEGRMEFHNETMESVMKRLSRWYTFEYSFENEAAKSYHFSARLDRNESISNILKMLEMSTEVNFAFEGDVILIK